MDFENKILIVDNDEAIRCMVSSYLEQHGFKTGTAADPVEMRSRLSAGRYDLIVLDAMMPGEDGLSALRKLQGDDQQPVIMLSSAGTEIDRIVGLEMGAQDYMAKPCNPRELLARIRVVLRRHGADAAAPPAPGAQKAESWTFAGWRMEPASRKLYGPDGNRVTLSDSEFSLLRAFIECPRRILTREELLEYTSRQDGEHFDRVVDVQVSRLRRRLALDGEANDMIRTVRNEGYLYVPQVTRVT